MTTFATVQEAFDRVYEQRREDTNENAPDSNVWFAPTVAALIEEVTTGFEGEIREKDDAGEWLSLGDADAPAIAWAYEVNGQNLYRISEHATENENELVRFFGLCMGYDL